ncbi:hypothetical protein B0J17DRAFT_663596 [Rhizoctonia solani]|nr:hypothetical protein B0J17DRAFT_663596 [Rhizoctonia solani]
MDKFPKAWRMISLISRGLSWLARVLSASADFGARWRLVPAPRFFLDGSGSESSVSQFIASISAAKSSTSESTCIAF